MPPASPSAPYGDSDLVPKTSILGAVLGGMGYGVVFTLFIMCFYLLSKNMAQKQDYRKQNIFFLVYISVMFVLCTLVIESDVDRMWRFSQEAGADHSWFFFSIGYIGELCSVITIWATDALLVWRCFIMYCDLRMSPWVFMAVPLSLLCGSIAIGILLLVNMSYTYTESYANLLSAFGYVTISLNIIVTCMVAVRILLHRHSVIRAFGFKHGTHYVGILTMMIESAILVVIFDIFFIVPFSLQNPIANIPQQCMVHIQAIASFLIIFRVAQGKAFNRESAIRTQDIADRLAELTFARSNNDLVESLEDPDRVMLVGHNADVIDTEEMDGKVDKMYT
ncbi:hypothetical protein BDQ12DRAFT_712478 [Crucibulum laeve]|uniref:Uncharacterized protein n=1 Tax=Crucibulum laeve TaxID=68775 RepID=A0A5C3M1A2_9AGAR|nr:hypothetical protein BDQ12DRAFT_712478 [Crucibulum laeve]